MWDRFVFDAASSHSPQAQPIAAWTTPDDTQSVDYFRHRFELDALPTDATLTIAVWGVGSVRINNRVVDDEVLFPGWTDYRFQQRVATIDIAGYLTRGTNVISVQVGDGWYRGRLGALGDRHIYGDTRGLLAQITIDHGQTVLPTEGWRCFRATHVSASIYDGWTFDARAEPLGWQEVLFDDEAWPRALQLHVDLETLTPRLDHGIAEIARGQAVLIGSHTAPLFDCGANRAGVVRVEGTGSVGQTVVVRHCEILNPDGTPNYLSNRGALATDVYIIGASGEFSFEPQHTYHGFRYVVIESDAQIDRVEWVALSSAREASVAFTCSHPLFNSMHQAAIRTAQSNLFSIPTDCPQRDERLGWTGDAQLYAQTAMRQFTMFGFWSSWLSDVRDSTSATGTVPPLVPDIVRGRPLSLGPGLDVDIYNRAGWADALVDVPYEMWRTGGDPRLVLASLGTIRLWIDQLVTTLTPEHLLPEEFQFGDWLDPQAPAGKPWLSTLSPQFIANAYLVRSLERASELENGFGVPVRGSSYSTVASQVRASLWTTMGEAATQRQGGCATLLMFDICPAAERARVAQQLAALVRSNDYRIGTGFLTTPLILDALTLNGYQYDAFRMLLNETLPSWAGQMCAGATTWWERWDALNPDGTVGDATLDGTDAGMISFNHLVNGAVASWIYDRVAGVRLDFRGRDAAVTFQPILSSAVTSAALTQETLFGTFSVEWHIESDGPLHCAFDIPEGMVVDVKVPMGPSAQMRINGGRVEATDHSLAAGHHTVRVSEPWIVKL